ncbi:UDP-N-acetylmuramoyl-L-alanine--D-glutamate ligase [endosymbiont of Pachyrhynchus infernalis]|uniref:UDP-N-acetylmuramoyl-L-alanine--D-glutamate ligase n=1 Tax=endosymbiont of Pachyrhynchus infernalis TaxID=1971488 RepID=UPI000DC6DAA8|nr:UDP-N-acetylmuramoyl-L-alanine--D-glutamate ligase [endosymbiont of Pachyrhynchus infernalis]BBA84765.1 UDP-N-acetylmuramoylalanine--D-glutamate ligase [endosymbiont of Pachyrhynchus infernalis]
MFKNKNIFIIGSGITGISCINYLLKKECNLTLIDTRLNPPNLNLIPDNINTFFGKNVNFNMLLKSDLVVISPGFDYKLINNNILNKINITSDIELFCKEKPKSKIIAITGTNGKSTVSTLIFKILKNNNYLVYLGGNIGNPVLNSLNIDYDFYVFELSSFQLEILNNLKSFSSSILNIGFDHLDRHINIKNYINSKLKIFNNSYYCVINIDDNLSYPNKINLNSKYEFFGINSGNYHLKFIKDKIYLMYKNDLIIDSSKLKIFGIHNYINVLSSLSCIKYINLNFNKVINTIKKFKPLNHRLNLILNINNITWINDSKSTNISSTISAINSIKFYSTIHLIIGGYRKNIDFNLLKSFLKNKNIKIYCFGIDGKYISNLFNKKSIYYYDLESIVYEIYNKVKINDVVLFSPACSSIDNYNNYIDRGNHFIKIVNKLYKINDN